MFPLVVPFGCCIWLLMLLVVVVAKEKEKRGKLCCFQDFGWRASRAGERLASFNVLGFCSSTLRLVASSHWQASAARCGH